MKSTLTRVPAGVPAGGQFVASGRAETSLALAPADPAALGLPAWTPPHGLGTTHGAFSRCKEVSAEYTEHLHAHGVEARWIQVQGCYTPRPSAHPAWRTIEPTFWNHYVTVVRTAHGEHYVDWTARQFDPQAALPVVGTDLVDGWHEAYDVTARLGAYLDSWQRLP